MMFGFYRLSGRFAQLANFISDLEDNVPLFYRQVGQNLSQWKKPAPQIKEISESVDVEAKSKEAEDFWFSPLELHVLPKLGRLHIEQIDQKDIADTVSKIWHSKAETARKAMNRLGIVFNTARQWV